MRKVLVLSFVCIAFSTLSSCGDSSSNRNYNAATKDSIAHYSEEGTRLRNSNQYYKAIDKHRRALELAKTAKDTTEAIRALNNIGTDYRRLGILDEASTFHYKALEMCGKFSDKTSTTARKNRVISLNGIGNICLTMKNSQLADSMFRMALEGERQLGSELGQAINYANIGALFEEAGKDDSAMEYYRKSMEMNIKANSALGMSLCYTYYGHLHEKHGETAKAAADYNEAYRLMKNHGDSWHSIESCLALANLYINNGKMGEARPYIEEAREIADTINSLEHLARVYDMGYRIYSQRGDYKNALYCYEKSRNYMDSVTNEKNMAHLQNERINYERQKKDDEIKLMQLNFDYERQRRNILEWASLAIIAVAAIAITFLIIGIRLRTKNLKLLREKYLLLIEHDKTPETTDIPERDKLFVEKFRKAVSENIAKGKMDYDALAYSLCTSRTSLNRRIKSITGFTTTEFIAQMRLAKAKKRLDETDKPINIIAMECGIDNVPYFNTMFKKTTGMTPTQYKTRRKRSD